MKLRVSFGAVLLALTTLLGRTSAHAATIHVPGDYPLIQAAIDAAVNGDSVVIAPGTYTENVENDKVITVTGTNPSDPDVVASTIIRAAMQGPAVSYISGTLQGLTITDGSPGLFVGRTVTIRHCLIRNNSNQDWYGGGATVDGGNVTFEDCIFRDNSSTYNGGGVAMILGSSTFRRCLFENNTAPHGGAAFVGDAQPTFVDCTFRGNRVDAVGCSNSICVFEGCTFTTNEVSYGGAIFSDASTVSITASVFTDNITAGSGAAIALWGSSGAIRNCLIARTRTTGILAVFSDTGSVVIENCTVVDNTTLSGSGVYSDGSATLRNCVVWGNSQDQVTGVAASYSNIEDGWPGVGNINADPMFRSYRGFDHVLAPGSPCIDAGDPTLEDGMYDTHPRWPNWYQNGVRSDMGAYGGPDNRDWLR